MKSGDAQAARLSFPPQAVLVMNQRSEMQKNKSNRMLCIWFSGDRGGGDLQCSVYWVKNSGRLPPPRVHDISSSSYRRQVAKCVVASARTAVWLQVGQEPIVAFPISANPCPRNNKALSHRAEWLRPLWLQSICRHSYSALSLLLISLPPLHFSKLRCNFVSLQWFHPSALCLLLFLLSSKAAGIQGLVVLHWMTNQGHICSTFRYLYL